MISDKQKMIEIDEALNGPRHNRGKWDHLLPTETLVVRLKKSLAELEVFMKEQGRGEEISTLDLKATAGAMLAFEDQYRGEDEFLLYRCLQSAAGRLTPEQDEYYADYMGEPPLDPRGYSRWHKKYNPTIPYEPKKRKGKR